MDKKNTDQLLTTAMQDPDVPKIYFNGFQSYISASDIKIVVQNIDRPMAVLEVSHGIAKELVEKLGGIIQKVEQDAGHTFLTSAELQGRLTKKG